MVLAYFPIGSMIIEDVQNEESRADYAGQTLNRLSKALTIEFGNDYSLYSY